MTTKLGIDYLDRSIGFAVLFAYRRVAIDRFYRACSAFSNLSATVGELCMRALSLAEALKIIEGTFAAAKEHNCHALAGIVLDAGGEGKGFSEAGWSFPDALRIAYGK